LGGWSPILSAGPLHLALALPVDASWFAEGAKAPLSGFVLYVRSGMAASVWIALEAHAGRSIRLSRGNFSNRHSLPFCSVVVLEAARPGGLAWPVAPGGAHRRCFTDCLGNYNSRKSLVIREAPLASFLGTLTMPPRRWSGQSGGPVSVRFVAIFVIFGAVLNAGEAGQGFMNLLPPPAGTAEGWGGEGVVISLGLVRIVSGSASAKCCLDRGDQRCRR